jgi:hypothetical protein
VSVPAETDRRAGADTVTPQVAADAAPEDAPAERILLRDIVH